MTLKGHKRGESLADRFWAKVNKDGPVHPVLKTRCWLWTGSMTRYGYIRSEDNKKTVLAHRVAWFLETGEWPEQALHHCDNTACVRFDHLFDGDAFANHHDSAVKGRRFRPRGSKHHLAKLTEADVLSIRSRYVSQLRKSSNAKELAAEFGVTEDTVKAIANRRAWRHV